MEDGESVQMTLNLHKREWDYLHHLIKGKVKPFVTIAKVKQMFCQSTNTMELYGTSKSTINLFDNDSVDGFALSDYSIVKVHFLNQDNELVCMRELQNINEPFDNIEQSLFESCFYCFFAVKKGTISHNVGTKKKLYCPKCGKEYKINLMFTKVKLEFKKNKFKHFGDITPVQLTASITHKTLSTILQETLASTEYGIIAQNFQQNLQNDLRKIFSGKWNAKIHKVSDNILSQLSDCNFVVGEIEYVLK